jgi:pyrroline-5-carboxylate reductase
MSIINGLIKNKTIKPSKINVNDIDKTKTTKSKEMGINFVENINELVKKSNIIILSIKPNSINEVINEINQDLNETHLIISILAV